MKYIAAAFLAVFLVFSSHSYLMAQDDAALSVGFKEIWADKDADLSSYKDIKVYNIDLREITQRVTDIDDEVTEQSMEDYKLHAIGRLLFDNFSSVLEEVMPVGEYEHEPSREDNVSSVLLSIRLSGRFESEETGALMRIVTKGRDVPADKVLLSIECMLSDGATSSEIVSLWDSQDFISISREDPLSSKEDLDELAKILFIWAKRLANFMEKHREMR